jgi:hypothetical protein
MKRTILTRVESWVNLGIPDCIVALDNRFFLVELKVVRKGNKVVIRPHQVAFHTMHGLYPCFILVEVGIGRAKELKLYHARQAMELADQGLKITPAGVFPGNDWGGVESFLSSW